MGTTARTIDEIKNILIEGRAELEKRFGVSELGIFGSRTRGTSLPASDIDILVSFSREIDYFEFLDLEEYLCGLLGSRVDLVEKRALKPHIGRHILEEAIML